MSWLRLVNLFGLTNLSDNEVRRYEERELSRSFLSKHQNKIVVVSLINEFFFSYDWGIIVFILGFIVKPWTLTFGQCAAILLASSFGAPLGYVFYSWLADKIGPRRVIAATILNVSIATGAIALAPDHSWIYVVFWRVVVGFGGAIFSQVNMALMFELSPVFVRWSPPVFRSLSTVVMISGFVLGAVLGGFATSAVGWRGLAAIGALPVLWTLYVFPRVSESPRWLIREGRATEARQSLARAMGADPREIELPATSLVIEGRHWAEFFRHPARIALGGVIGLGQAAGSALTLWMVTLFVMVLRVSPQHASRLAIVVGLAAVLGRILSEYFANLFGRRSLGIVIFFSAALYTSLAGFLHNVYIGALSLFLLMIIVQKLFDSGSHLIVEWYTVELWPTRLRSLGASYMYNVQYFGVIIGLAGLAWIAGSSNYVTQQATLDAIIPGLNYFAFWYFLGGASMLLLPFREHALTIDDIQGANNDLGVVSASTGF